MSDAKRSSDDIQKEISRLQQEFEVAQKTEIEAFLAEVKPKIAKYKLTAEQLGISASRTPQNEKKSGVEKGKVILYQKGDLTWSGRGRKPNWVKEQGEEIEKYRV